MEARILQLPVFMDEPDESTPSVPGPELAASLPSDFDALSDDELLEAAADARRLASWAQSRELAAIAALHRRRTEAEEECDPDHRILDAHESVCLEVSAALAVTGNTASTLVDLADRLTHHLPGTHRALETGHLDFDKARVFSELTHDLDPELCRHIEARVLPTADQRTTGQLRRRIRTLVQRLAPGLLQRRKREAVHDRRLQVWDDDSTATTNLVLSGLDPLRAHSIFNRITAVARGVKTNGDPRTLHQIRADLAQQLLQGHDLPEAVHQVAEDQAGSAAVIEPTSESPTMPMDAGAGACDAIAGLIADMADRELTQLRDHLKATGRTRALAFQVTRAAQGIHDRLTSLRETWCRTHDPAHGRILYRPSTTLRRAIEARHITCTFPTCNQPSSRSDLDHTIPWGRGKSCQCNLAPLCRKHHRAKQTPGWNLVQPWPGLLLWITPAGKWHITLPTRQ